MFVKTEGECNIASFTSREEGLPGHVFAHVCCISFFFCLKVQSHHEFHNILMENLRVVQFGYVEHVPVFYYIEKEYP
jgi:hypothetical protein